MSMDRLQASMRNVEEVLTHNAFVTELCYHITGMLSFPSIVQYAVGLYTLSLHTFSKLHHRFFYQVCIHSCDPLF